MVWTFRIWRHCLSSASTLLSTVLVSCLLIPRWFHGHMSSVHSEEILPERARGTYLVRFSSSPACFALSVLSEHSKVRHYKITRKTNGCFLLSGVEYHSLESLIENRKDHLNLKFACPRGERYSDSNWPIFTQNENDERSPISLKQLGFRFVYRNSQLFPRVREKLPTDLTEQYFSAVVDSATADENGRQLWKTYLLGKEWVSWEEFQSALCSFLKIRKEDHEHQLIPLREIVQDICNESHLSITVEIFSKLLDWFGPLDSRMLHNIQDVTSREYDILTWH